jgi:hypothetical protein
MQAGLMPVRPIIVIMSDTTVPEGCALKLWKE